MHLVQGPAMITYLPFKLTFQCCYFHLTCFSHRTLTFVFLFFSNKKYIYIALLLQVAFKWATSFLFASESWSKGVFSPKTDKRHIRVAYLSNEQNWSISQNIKLKFKVGGTALAFMRSRITQYYFINSSFHFPVTDTCYSNYSSFQH